MSGGHTKVVTRMTPGYLCILDICPGQDSGSRVSTKKETKTPAALSPDWCRAVCLLPFTPDTASLPRPTTCMIFVLPNTVRNCAKHGAAWTLDTEHWSTSRFLIVCLLLGPGLDCGMEIGWSALLPHHPASSSPRPPSLPGRDHNDGSWL